MKDGIYFLFPQGSAWVGAIFKDGKLMKTIQEANTATHLAAQDDLAGIIPDDSDTLVEDECEEIITEVLGEDIFPELVIVTRQLQKSEYVLFMTDEGGSSHKASFGEDRPSEYDINCEIEEWCEDGDWGDNGASIDINWTLELNGEEIDDGLHTVEIEPNHSKLISNACRYNNSCGDDPKDHDWTSEGEGGLDSNPGVWSTGGTSLVIKTHCCKCGIHRTEHHIGSQRNSGEHDSVTYEMPDEWCSECENSECFC